MIISVGGLVMLGMLFVNCDVQRIKLVDPATGQPSATAQQYGYGFISREPQSGEVGTLMGCLPYPDAEKTKLFDVWFQMGRFMVYLSAIFGCIGLIVLSAAICIAWSVNTFQHWLLWNYIFAAIVTGLAFLIFGSNFCSANECKLGKGGVSVISIFFFWLVAANTVKSMPEAEPDEGEDDDDLYYETVDDMYDDNVRGLPGPNITPYYQVDGTSPVRLANLHVYCSSTMILTLSLHFTCTFSIFQMDTSMTMKGSHIILTKMERECTLMKQAIQFTT
jgi:hypothetical protein